MDQFRAARYPLIDGACCPRLHSLLELFQPPSVEVLGIFRAASLPRRVELTTAFVAMTYRVCVSLAYTVESSEPTLKFYNGLIGLVERPWCGLDHSQPAPHRRIPK
jgi:hypothetical protein